MTVVSVNIPTKNSARTLSECVDSVLRQNEDVEIIVADDCSADGTVELAESLGARVLKGPLRLLEARYQAFRHSSGPLILMLDSDQVLEHQTLKHCLQAMDSYEALILEEKSAGEPTWLSALFAADRRLLHAEVRHHKDPIHGSLLPRFFRADALAKAFGRIPARTRLTCLDQDHAIITAALGSDAQIGFVRSAVRHREMERFNEFWKKQYRWGRLLADFFRENPQYRTLTRAKLLGRMRRGGAPFDDFAKSLLLLGLKSVPYTLGYLEGLVTRNPNSYAPR
jgi:glycosyltransferase involved in cell wall biosynthesis